MTEVRFPAGAENYSVRHRCVLTDSGVHLTSYPVGTGDSFPGVEAGA